MMRSLLLLGAALAIVSCRGQEVAEPRAEPAVEEPAPLAGAKVAAVAEPQQAVSVQSVGCAEEEATLFSCQTESGKTIAVCSAGDKSASYRFGADKPELALEGGEWARVPYSGGGEFQIAFDNGDTRYIVFSRTVRTNFKAGEPNNPAMSDGVIVMRGERFVDMQTCTPGTSVAAFDEAGKNALERLPQAEELFTYETGRADDRK